MADIDRRIAAFDKLASRFPCARVRPLILVYNPSDKLGTTLTNSVIEYLRAAARPENPRIDDEMAAYDRGEIYAVTPAGMVVPKSTSWLEYNKVVRAFADIIEAMNISDLIETWHVPLNVRFKRSHPDENNVKRPHATEKPHSDSWAGESTESVTVHIPILGDTQGNFLKLFYPRDFKEEWLGSHGDYEQGHVVLPNYDMVDYIIPRGRICLIDFATLHASTTLPNCGPRVSIDTTFVLKKRGMAERIHKNREHERMNPDLLRKIGETHLFYFRDGPNDKVEVSGFKHPTRLLIKTLV